MQDFFINLNQGIYPGVAVFTTFLVMLIEMYRLMYNEPEREIHKNFLLNKLDNFSHIPFNRVGTKSALAYTHFMEKILGKPRKYKVQDPVFWNYKSTLLFILFACIIVIYSTYKWSNNYFDYYPIFILVISFLSFSLGIVQENLENKINKKEYVYHAYFILISAMMYGIPSTLLIWISIYFGTNPAIPTATLGLLLIYSIYYIFGVFLLSISRIQIRKIAYSLSIPRTLWIFLESSLLFAIVLFISGYLSDAIIYMHYLLHSEEENFQNLELHKNIVFFTLLSPFILFLLIALIEIVFKFFVTPLQFLINVFFNFIIKRNIHLLLLGSALIYILTKI